jgi:hypothetical protein
MQVVDASGNVFGQGLEITDKNGKPKVPVINTNITIGTTVIAGGVSGRLLFDDAGVVGETNGVNWDKVNNILTVSKPTGAIVRLNSLYSDVSKFQFTQEISVGTPTEIGYISNQFGTGMILSSFNSLYFNAGNAEKMRISSSTGNVLINTTTDAGYKLDVAGDIRTQNAIRIFNPAFTFGGSIVHSANATLAIVGGPGGDQNITFGPSNRIFINAQQTRFPSGNVQMASTLTLGSTNATSTNMLLMQGSITAASSLGRGIGLDTTLVASANNDVLIGLDVQSAFTNGAFTGVQNYAARFGGNVIFTQGAKTISIAAPTTSGSGGGLTISAGNATTSGTGGSISLQPGNGAGGPGAGTVIISNTSWWNGATVNGTLTVTNSGPNTGTSLQVNAGGQNGLTISWDNLTPFMQYGLVSGRQSRFVNSSSYSFSTNLIIGGTTNAGYMLDINGTSRYVAQTYYGTFSESPTIYSSDTFLNYSASAASLAFYLRNGFGGSGRFIFSSAAKSGLSGTQYLSYHTATFNPTSGTAEYVMMNLEPTINQTGGANGITRGLYINPTLTAAADFRAIETTAGSVIFNGPTTINNRYLYHQGTSAIQYFMTSNAWSGTNTIFFGDDSSSTIGSLSYNHQFDSFAITVNGNNRMQIASTGNVLIGTTADSGYKLNVNGTTYSSSFVGSGLQIYGQVQVFNGNAFQIFNTANNSKASIQYINQSGLAIGINSENLTGVTKLVTIGGNTVASANNDVLVGLDIAPTYTNGAFTGVTNLALRASGNIRLQGSGFGIDIPFSSSFINMQSGNVLFQKTYLSNTDPQKINLSVNRYIDHADGAVDIATCIDARFEKRQSANVSISTTVNSIIVYRPTSSGNLLQVRGYNISLDFKEGSTVSAPFIGYDISSASKGTTGNVTSFIGYQVTDNSISSIVYGFRSLLNSGTGKWGLYFDGTANNYLAGNLFINTTTDAGYKLDVNGTARVTNLKIDPVGTINFSSPTISSNQSSISSTDGDKLLLSSSFWNTISAGQSIGLNATYVSLTGASGTTPSVGLTFFRGSTPLAEHTTFHFGKDYSEAIGITGRARGATQFFINRNIDASTSRLIDFQEFGTSRFIVNSTGNVLIGSTTDAGYKLDVTGTGRFTQGLTVDYNGVKIGGVTLALGAQGAGTISSANSVGNPTTYITMSGPVYYNPTSGTAGTFAVTGQSYMNSGTAQFNTLTVAPIINNSGTYSGIFRGYYYNPTLTSLIGTTHRAIETTSGDVIFNGGNVGIGTSSPYYPLQITQSTINNYIELSGTTNKGLYATGSGLLNWDPSGNMNFYTGGVNLRATITSGGNVLIGTSTDAGYKLDVNGTGYFGGNLRVNGTVTASTPTANLYVCNIGLASDQSIPSLSDTQINFVDIDDTNNWYDPTTKKFLPNVAGYYHVDFGVWFDSATVATAQYNIQIRKNGSTVLIAQQPTVNNGTGQSLVGSKLIYFNGTTDYIDFTAYQSTGVNRTLQTGASSSGTYASIFLLAV